MYTLHFFKNISSANPTMEIQPLSCIFRCTFLHIIHTFCVYYFIAYYFPYIYEMHRKYVQSFKTLPTGSTTVYIIK